MNSLFKKEVFEERIKEQNFKDLRREVFLRDTSLPFPISKYTSFSDFDIEQLRFPPSESKPEIENLEPFPPYILMVENGDISFSKEFSQNKVDIVSLKKALRENPVLVEPLFKYPPQDKIQALHIAYTDTGLVIHIPEGTIIESPFRVIHYVYSDKTMFFPSFILVAEKNSYARIIYELKGKAKSIKGYSLTGLITLKENARVDLLNVQSLPDDTFGFFNQSAYLGRNSQLNYATGWFGTRKMKSILNVNLREPGAEVQNIEIFFTRKKEHYDLESNLIHSAEHTTGEFLTRGVLKDKSRGVIKGMIKVMPGAQKTNGFLDEKTILLSKNARSDANPSLEIEADDVRATHSASTGPIDRDQIFYLRTRGLNEETAIKTIVQGFLNPVLQKFDNEYLNSTVYKLIDMKWESRKADV